MPEPLSLIPPSKQFSMKQEIDINVAALKAYDSENYELALKTFEEIADSSRILFNMGMIHATIGEHKQAVGMSKESLLTGRYNSTSRPQNWIGIWPSLISKKACRTSCSESSKRHSATSMTLYSYELGVILLIVVSSREYVY